MITVIAEKPSVAKDIAKFLGATNTKDGYIEGNNYFVTWAFGHLVEIKDFKELGYNEKWSLETLPFIPEVFELKITGNSGAQKQFKVIKDLFQKSQKIICATDAGREGELIFRYIYELSKSKVDFDRLWISSLTDDAIKEGFSKLKKGNQFDNLFYSAKARNQADYIVGINATIGMTSKAASGLLSLGRVQTPTLALICQRFIQNRDFVPIAFYVPELLLFPLNKLEFKAQFETNLDSLEKANEILSSIGVSLIVKDIIKTEIKENPPTLFDLTLLQMEANKRFGFSAQKTLTTAQELYEKHKILTYPRTSSKFLSEDMLPKIPGLMKNVSEYHLQKEAIKALLNNPISTRPINNGKVTDHHAIIPTEKKVDFNSLNDDETKIYTLVSNRFIEAFMPACLKDSSKIIIETDKGNFSASGTIIKEEGWRKITSEKEEGEDSVNIKLPVLKIGESVSVIKKEVLKKHTKALPLFTESSLLHSMETAGKLVSEEKLAEAMKEGGLGTPATRASIIELLIKRQFIIRDKKNILPTDLGLNLYDLVKDLKISKAELTGEWESKLLQIEDGNYSFDQFNSEINDYIKELIESIKTMPVKFLEKEIIECPFCKKGMIVEKHNSYKCNNIDNGNCDFPIIWKSISGKNISELTVKDLVQNGKTSLIKGFLNKEKKSFDAILMIDQETKKLKFDFSKKEIAECPKCKTGRVEVHPKVYKCNNIEKCEFIIYKEIAKKLLTENEVIKLIKDKRTPLIKGFISNNGKSFDAFLKMDNEFKTSFEFVKK